MIGSRARQAEKKGERKPEKGSQKKRGKKIAKERCYLKTDSV
jgi:hypothetical protein